MHVSDWKLLKVIDSEYVRDAARVFVERHFTEDTLRHIRVAVVEPRHEAWLCIGLCGDRRGCRHEPEQFIERLVGDVYQKYMLARLARRISVEKLLGERDFQVYLEGLFWLLS